MTFCRSIHMKKVMKLLALIFEQPSYLRALIFFVDIGLKPINLVKMIKIFVVLKSSKIHYFTIMNNYVLSWYSL